jgi:23S rRNA (guanine745-N1)-methyltransferase
VVAALRCPVCGGSLEVVDRTLRCGAGHAYDVAKQGHVDLRGPRGSRGTGDDAAMIARRLAVLGAGYFDPLLDAIVAAVQGERGEGGGGGGGEVGGLPPGLIVDVGAGPGVHLARVLDALPGRDGLAVDVSRPAAQRAALAHPRAGAVVADVWHGLPIDAGAAAVVLDVFAPRHAEEFRRILNSAGRLVVVTPDNDHLGELAGLLGLVRVDPDKDRRLGATFDATFTVERRRAVRWTLRIDRTTAADVVGMGPGGHHADPDELARRAGRLPSELQVRAAVVVTTYRPRPDPTDGSRDAEEVR